MRQKHILTGVMMFAVLGTVNHSQSLAEAWQGGVIKNLSGMMTTELDRSLIYKVGADSYSGGYPGMSGADMKPGAMPSQQGATSGGQYRQTGDYKFSSPGNQSGYGPNTSDNYLRKESSGTTNSPYGGAVYGGVPTTPSADPMIKELNRDPSMR